MSYTKPTAGCRVNYDGTKIEIILCDKHRAELVEWHGGWERRKDERSLFDMVELIMKEGCRDGD